MTAPAAAKMLDETNTPAEEPEEPARAPAMPVELLSSAAPPPTLATPESSVGAGVSDVEVEVAVDLEEEECDEVCVEDEWWVLVVCVVVVVL